MRASTAAWWQWVRAGVSAREPKCGPTRSPPLEIDQQSQRVARLERAIDAAIIEAPAQLRAVVDALQTLRGVAKLTAVTLATEFGSLGRFSRAKGAMSHTGTRRVGTFERAEEPTWRDYRYHGYVVRYFVFGGSGSHVLRNRFVWVLLVVATGSALTVGVYLACRRQRPEEAAQLAALTAQQERIDQELRELQEIERSKSRPTSDPAPNWGPGDFPNTRPPSTLPKELRDAPGLRDGQGDR